MFNSAFCQPGSSALPTGTTVVPYSQKYIGSQTPCSITALVAWMKSSRISYGTVFALQKNGFASCLKANLQLEVFKIPFLCDDF